MGLPDLSPADGLWSNQGTGLRKSDNAAMLRMGVKQDPKTNRYAAKMVGNDCTATTFPARLGCYCTPWTERGCMVADGRRTTWHMLLVRSAAWVLLAGSSRWSPSPSSSEVSCLSNRQRATMALFTVFCAWNYAKVLVEELQEHLQYVWETFQLVLLDGKKCLANSIIYQISKDQHHCTDQQLWT